MTTTTTESPQWGQQSGSALAKVEAPPTQPISVFTGGMDHFNNAQRMAAALCSAAMVPDAYRGNQNLGNCLVALDLANRLGVSPLAVMQNVETIHGKPAFRSSFLIAMINGCGRFSPLEFHFDDEANPTSCYAAANVLATGVRLTGQKVTVQMAKDEGWWGRKGSKWPNMTGQMLAYRAASFWQRLHAAGLTVGFATAEEVIDVESVVVTDVKPEPAAAPVPEPEPAQAAKPKATRARRGSNPPAPGDKPPAPPSPPATVAEVMSSLPAEAELLDATPAVAPSPEPPATIEAEPAPEQKDPRTTLGSLPADQPAAAPAAPQGDEPIDVVPLGEFAQQGLTMIVQQCQVKDLEEFAGQVHAFAKAGSMTEAEGERLLAAVLTRKGYLQKALTPFEATAAVTKIQATEGLERRFRDAFGFDDSVALADVVTSREHVETVKVLLAAGGS